MELRRAWSIAALTAISTSAMALPCNPNVMPLPEPQASESPLASDAELETGCMALIQASVSLVGTHLGKPMFAVSDMWGKLLRIDIGEPSPSRYSRIVCFKRPSDLGVQMGIYDLSKDMCEGSVAGFTLYAPRVTPPHR